MGELYNFVKEHKYKLVAVAAVSTIVYLGLGSETIFDTFEHQRFLKQEMTSLEGKVVDERYVQPIGSFGNSRPSEYFFSLEETAEKQVTIDVRDSYEPRIPKESIDVRLQPGTKVVVNARKIAPGEYRTFAGDVSVAP